MEEGHFDIHYRLFIVDDKPFCLWDTDIQGMKECNYSELSSGGNWQIKHINKEKQVNYDLSGVGDYVFNPLGGIK